MGEFDGKAESIMLGATPGIKYNCEAPPAKTKAEKKAEAQAKAKAEAAAKLHKAFSMKKITPESTCKELIDSGLDERQVREAFTCDSEPKPFNLEEHLKQSAKTK